ncbi:hypothetical protein CAPTEDRAFT_207542 [Capitella teleta]|uniref:Uncharacterized protein n=1 Tax=Capitella teleta TaxID=283909 RepID=R7V7K0_CAPTE|nr:hypothetical protein CAPTEDRAFT_207542 [Capitella teleta]|eukprot:ELU14833.1 hypothetical protein CAPTEDRAFT_207542 [Capitella teleta]
MSCCSESLELGCSAGPSNPVLNMLVEQFLSESIAIKSADPSTSLKNQGSILSSQLYLASFWGFRDIVRRILELAKDQEIPFDVNAQNKVSLWTPLHAAAFQEHGPIVMMLLEHGADPNSTDSNGRSPKDFASASDKLWGHFAMLGLKRTDRSTLVSMGILKQVGGDMTASPPGSASLTAGRGIPL